MSKESGIKDEGGQEIAQEAVASGSIWEAKTPRADGTRKHVVVTSANRVSVTSKDARTGESKKMPRWRFFTTYRPSNGKADKDNLWGEATSDNSGVVLGPEMRKLRAALDKQPRAAIVNVIWPLTHALATEIIATEKRNRQSSDARVRLYAHDQNKGNWVATHQGIAFGPDMDLVDGGHRCKSVMVTGATVDVQVSQYTSREHCEAARKNLDGQYTRSKGHVLEIDGLVEKGKGKAVAATIDAMKFVDTRVPLDLTKAETEELFKHRKASIAAIHSRVNSGFLSGVRAALVIAHMRAPEAVEALVDLVKSCANIEYGSAAQMMALRIGKLQTGGSRSEVTDAILSTLAICYLHVKGLRPTRTGSGRSSKSFAIESAQVKRAIKFFLGEHYREPSVAPEQKQQRAA